MQNQVSSAVFVTDSKGSFSRINFTLCGGLR